MDVIQFFNDVADSEEVMSRITHKLCRNIIQGLDEATLWELRSRASLDWYLRKLVDARLEKQGPSDATPIQYNKSWRAYLKDIQQRKLGRISLARKKLREAFPHIEWQAQCKIPSSCRTRRRMRGLGHCRPLCISGRCSLGEGSD